MTDDKIFTIHRSESFTLADARETLPVVRRITKEYILLVEQKMHQLQSLGLERNEKSLALEQEVNDLVVAWQKKIRKLGAQPKGLWLVDFDSGSGFYCWKYPETELNHWHRYEDGYSKRQPIVAEAFPLQSTELIEQAK
jgi:hypothetical protein